MSCEFVNTEKASWYKHKNTSTDRVAAVNTTHQDNVFNCRTCNNEFQSRNDLMYHRKHDHPGSVFQCENYLTGRCNEDSWYPHGQLHTPALPVVRQIVPNTSSRQDFPEAPILDQRNPLLGQQTQTKQVLIMLQQQQQNQNRQM